MNARKLTEHAQRRKQQRGISDLQVELILAFGDDHYQKGGASLSYISGRKINQLREALDRIENVAIVKTPTEGIATVMHMERRIRSTEYVA